MIVPAKGALKWIVAPAMACNDGQWWLQGTAKWANIIKQVIG